MPRRRIVATVDTLIAQLVHVRDSCSFCAVVGRTRRHPSAVLTSLFAASLIAALYLWTISAGARTAAEPGDPLLPAAVWIVLAGTVAVLLAGTALWYVRRLRRQSKTPSLLALIHALHQVDMFGNRGLKLEFKGRGQTADLADAVNHVFERLELYKQRLVARDQRLRRMLGRVTDILYQADSQDRINWVTDSVHKVLGYNVEEIRGRALSQLMVDPERDMRLLEGHQEVVGRPVRIYRKDGSTAWLLTSVRKLRDGDGHFIGTEGVCRDGTELILAEQALLKERRQAHTTLASIGDGVITTSPGGVVDYMNPAAEALTGRARADACGRRFDEVCKLVDGDSRQAISGTVENCIERGHVIHTRGAVMAAGDTRIHDAQVEVSVSPIRGDGDDLAGTVVVLRDVTELREISRQISHQATHDSLTGLANRQMFEHRLQLLLESARMDDTQHALCHIDVDRFKLINDTCGYGAGDELLRQIATQLCGEVRDADSLARLGGGVFGLILDHSSLGQAVSTAERLRARVDDFRFYWNQKLFRASVSIGVVAISRDSGSPADVLSNADTACYIAKDLGRNRVHVYRPNSSEIADRRSELQHIQNLTAAIDRNAFTLFGQVIRPVEWRPGEPVAVECLLRMRDGDNYLVGPSRFLPIAERYQIMPRIDRWVLQHALELIAHWQDRLQQVEYFSINLSGQSMTDDHFRDYALNALGRQPVDPRRIVFEITETTAVTNFGRAARLIKSLRDVGCRFALDDFGSGLSSFSYLKNLPLDYIKIDGAFVRDILSDPVDLETVKAINQVGHTMGVKTVAEYVECEDVLRTLASIGVDYVQGYHIGWPIAFDALVNSAYLANKPGMSHG